MYSNTHAGCPLYCCSAFSTHVFRQRHGVVGVYPFKASHSILCQLSFRVWHIQHIQSSHLSMVSGVLACKSLFGEVVGTQSCICSPQFIHSISISLYCSMYAQQPIWTVPPWMFNAQNYFSLTTPLALQSGLDNFIYSSGMEQNLIEWTFWNWSNWNINLKLLRHENNKPHQLQTKPLLTKLLLSKGNTRYSQSCRKWNESICFLL